MRIAGPLRPSLRETGILAKRARAALQLWCQFSRLGPMLDRQSTRIHCVRGMLLSENRSQFSEICAYCAGLSPSFCAIAAASRAGSIEAAKFLSLRPGNGQGGRSP